MSTCKPVSSYPFLAIAREHNIDYGLVLSYADLCQDSQFNEFWQEKATVELPLSVRLLIADEADKQHQIKWSG